MQAEREVEQAIRTAQVASLNISLRFQCFGVVCLYCKIATGEVLMQ